MYWVKLQPRTDEENVGLKDDQRVVQIEDSAVFLASAGRILGEELGFGRSVAGDAVLGDGRPIPCFSYSLVEYLLGLDLSGWRVLELGGGQSTAFWAAETAGVTTLETDPAWAERIAGEARANVTVETVPPDGLAGRMRALGRRYQAVVIDCAANRYVCARAAPAVLASGGVVILDNSDWYPNASAALREAGLIQVDFHDFRPSHHFRCTSSLFLHPAFRPKPRAERLPLPPIGGKGVTDNGWDAVVAQPGR